MRSKVYYNNSSFESQLMAYTYPLFKVTSYDASESTWPISDSGKS